MKNGDRFIFRKKVSLLENRSVPIFVLALLVLPACATAPSSTDSLPSRAAFSEQVLQPLAQQTARTILDEWKTKARKEASLSGGVIQDALSTAIKETCPTPMKGLCAALGELLLGNPTKQYERYVALLDSLQAPLTARLLGLYEWRAVDQGDRFSVCVMGKERRYARKDGFPRQEDGSANCPQTAISLADLEVMHAY